MKTIKIILKGLLMYITLFSCIAFIIGGAVSLIDQNKWLTVIIWAIVNLLLVYLWYNTISYREANKLSFTKEIDSLFN